MVRRRRTKSKNTLIHEQAARGTGHKPMIGRTSSRVIDINNPPKDAVGVPLTPRRAKPLERDGRLENVKGKTSELVRAYTEPVRGRKAIKRQIKDMAMRLAKKPYAKWTAQEMAEAQRLLGPEVVAGIYSYQQRKRRTRQGSPN